MILLAKSYSALRQRLTLAERWLTVAGTAAAALLAVFKLVNPFVILVFAALRAVGYFALHFVCRSAFVPVSDFDEADRDRPEAEKENHVV